MKIGIITIQDSRNYGNRLQNYAVAKVLEKNGDEVCSYGFERMYTASLKQEIKKFVHIVTRYRLSRNSKEKIREIGRETNFLLFNRRNIKGKYLKSIEDISADDADCFFVGSDQVWNPAWFSLPEWKYKKDAFFLTFARDNQKLCFSPSFGIDEVPDEWYQWFKENISKFSRLSVREESGAAIIKEMTGQDAKVLIDPTMMLTASDWNEIAIPPKKVDCQRQYIFVYFLGELTDDVNSELQEYANKNSYEIYNIRDKENIDLFISGPAEFVYLLGHASMVVTDSFHACAFSLIYGKDFVVYPRKGKTSGMMSRIDTLLDTFMLEGKITEANGRELIGIDYNRAHKILEEKRTEAYEYIDEALDSCRK